MVQGIVITGSIGVFIANTAVVGLVNIVVAAVVRLRAVGLLLWTDGAAVVIVKGEVGFAGVIDVHLILGTV